MLKKSKKNFKKNGKSFQIWLMGIKELKNLLRKSKNWTNQKERKTRIKKNKSHLQLKVFDRAIQLQKKLQVFK